MKAVTAACIDHARVGRDVSDRLDEAADLEAAPNLVYYAEVRLGEIERVIVVRMVLMHRPRRGPRIEVHDRAIRALHRQERVGRGAVLDVFADADRRAVHPATVRARYVLELSLLFVRNHVLVHALAGTVNSSCRLATSYLSC